MATPRAKRQKREARIKARQDDEFRDHYPDEANADQLEDELAEDATVNPYDEQGFGKRIHPQFGPHYDKATIGQLYDDVKSGRSACIRLNVLQ